MPPTKPKRSVRYEANVSERIRMEREIRGWSLDNLARRMTEAGCPVDRSAVYKIERADRRISLDEAATIARVFKVPLTELIHPPAFVANRKARKLYERYLQVSKHLDDAFYEMQRLRDQLLALADDGNEEAVLEALATIDGGQTPAWMSPGGMSHDDVLSSWRSDADRTENSDG